MHTHTPSRLRRSFIRTAAGIAALGLLGFGLTGPAEAMTAPYSTPGGTSTANPGDDATETPKGEQEINDAVFEWSVNDESTGGSYFGGCNYLAAGEAGDSGMARIWTDKDAGTLYKTDKDGNFTEGNVSVVKETGKYSTFKTRCAKPTEEDEEGEMQYELSLIHI